MFRSRSVLSKVGGHIAHQCCNCRTNPESILPPDVAAFRIFVHFSTAPRAVRVETLASGLLPPGERNRTVRILLLDDDLGFLFWIAKALEPLGHQVVPADTVSQAAKLTRRLKSAIDLLIVNPDVPGALEFTETLRQREGTHVKIVAVVPPEELHAEHQIAADATRAKPDPVEIVELHTAAELSATQPSVQSEWVRFIQQMLGHRTAGSRAN